MVADNRIFMSKVNPQWFPDLVKEARHHIGNKCDDFVVLYSEPLEEHFMMYNSMSKKGQLKVKCPHKCFREQESSKK